MRDKRRACRVVTALVSCLAAVLLVSAAAHAASSPPANDVRAKAELVKTLPANVVGTTAGAKHEAADPGCAGPVRQTVWYRFTRSTPGTVLVSFQSLGQLDAVVSVYQVVDDQLKLLRCETSDTMGRWRVRATFHGTGTASPSRSDYANVVVATL